VTLHGGDPSAESLWERGERMELVGNVEAALDFYSRASVSGAEPPSARCALRHAEQLEMRGDWAAERYFRRAADDPDPSLRAQAWRGLATLEHARGDVPAALEALQCVIDTGDPEEMPRALRNIGVMFDDAGEVPAARTAYERAIATGHPQQAPASLVNLAQLHEKVGDLSLARSCFEQAIETHHPVEGRRARVLLGYLLQNQGDLDAAFASFAAVDGDPGDEWVQRAAMSAGAMLIDRGDHAAAADRLRIASRLADPSEAAFAQFLLGLAESSLGNVSAAKDAFEFAAANGRGDLAGRAAELARDLQARDTPSAGPSDGRELLRASRHLSEPVSQTALDAALGRDERVLRVADGSLLIWPDADRQSGVAVLTESQVLFVPEAQRRRLSGLKQPEVRRLPLGAMRSLSSRVGMLHIARSHSDQPQFADWLLDVGNDEDTRDFALAIMACPAYEGGR
jgi:tetratricopeptide (TPR) repeat protein